MSPRLDLIGQKFGKLTIISLNKSKRGRTSWNCICDCGKEIVIIGSSLVSGNTKSCGCYQKERASKSNFKDLTNQKFGRLTVTSFNKIENKITFWNCICNCGKEIVVSRNNLTHGNTKSCGCWKKETIHNRCFKDLTGQRFGRLFVKEYKGADKLRKSLYLCKCDCGKEITVVGHSLKNKVTQSCGCYNKEKARERCGDKSPNWHGGISFEPYCPLWTKDLRRRIREFFNNECIICGKTKVENKRELSCHHVEYNKKACCDGKPVYFATLCSSCHGKTNQDRERWESILHKIIDEIYEGKSYYTREEYKMKKEGI